MCSKSEVILIILGLPYEDFIFPLMFDSALNWSGGIFFKSETENYYGEIFNEAANVSSTVSQTCIHAILVCMNNQGQSIKLGTYYTSDCQVVHYLAVFTLTFYVLKKVQSKVCTKDLYQVS